MSVLINLLPDVRQARLRAEAAKRTATAVTMLICGAAVTVVVLLAVTVGGQRILISMITRDIQNKQAQLLQVEGIEEAYNAERHLSSLPGLYNDRAYLSQFFAVFQGALPLDVVVTSLNVTEGNTVQVTGTARTYTAAATFAKALNASGIKVGPNASEDGRKRFNEVTLEGATGDTEGRVSFTLTTAMDGEVIRGGN